ncbi:MAG: transglycosylase SLT domain-containing protein, partial [Rhodanobacteraceae bacterium]
MSIAVSKRTHWRAFTHILAAVLLVAIAASCFAQASATTSAVTQQRNAFRAAYAAAQKGQAWRPLAKGLLHYPLYPYLEAAALQHDIETATPAEIDAYLQRYAGMIPADDLRKAELRWLAEQKNWKAFRHFYRPDLGDTLTCDALQANLAEGKSLDFDRDLASLWRQTSLPSACTPVLDAAAAQGLLTPKRVWARIERAADAGRTRTIEQSAKWLAGADVDAARRIVGALSSPGALLKKASTFADTPRNREAVSRALIRLAPRDSAQAITFWQSLSKRSAFDQDKPWRDRVLTALALYDAVDLGPDALARLTTLPAAAQTEATREWRVRVAVAQGDWKAAEAAIQALTPEEMQHDEWRYWKARIAQKLGRDAAALDDYTALAQEATFYGFLAADRADLPYSICPTSFAADPAMDRKLEAIPGFARAFEFFALGMFRPARREWNRAFARLTPVQQKQVAALASRMGWYDRAVFAFGKAGDLHYYVLRFPLADRQSVVTAAHAAGIDPAWAFAIIRA